jgi:hypothetical protein
VLRVSERLREVQQVDNAFHRITTLKKRGARYNSSAQWS